MKKTNLATNLIAYAFLLPAILGLLLLTILPILGIFAISLTNWSGLESPSLVGFANYIEIFTKDNYFFSSVIATLYFAFGAVVTGIVYSFSVALMLGRKVPLQGFWRSVFFLPYVVPIMGSSVVWSWMYEANFGVFNYFLSLFGMDKIQWLADERFSVPSIIIMTAWGTGNLIVIFMAGLQNVPRAYLEAVEMDGGNVWHKFRHITLPMMSPVIFFNFLMSVVVNLQSFVPAYTMTKGGPNDSTLFMVFLMYREGFMRNNFGHASALSLIFFVFVAALTGLIFATSRNWIFYEGK
jgi:multiple sugar transport system permease protein